jgi:hypothetical protein
MTTKRVIRAAMATLTAAAILTLPAPSAPADVISDDSPGWSCVDDGNRICGPGNDEGKPAACYDDGGVIVAVWPCEAWKPSDGWRHADGTVTYPASGPNAFDAGSYVGGWN